MTALLALLLDALFGEPRWLWERAPHPAVLMGRAVGWADRRFNTGAQRKARGAAVIVALALGAALLGAALAEIGWLVEAVAAAILLAQRSLVEHVRAVAQGLSQSLADGRRAVAMIVGRDTASMDRPAVARAAIESGAENLSDGVIAPLFWLFLGGLPGMMAYKMVNTADSMIGYRTPRHAEFGWASARLDDVLNWVPARLTALLLLIGLPRSRWRGLRAEARLHRSPNAGWPEAAMARALGVALSGPRSYDGQMQDFPWVYPAGSRTPGPAEIEAACDWLWRAWLWGLLAAVIIAVF